jgi:hypothetical protein
VNERELGSKIAGQLEQGANQLRQGTLYRLQAARSAALQKYQAEPELAVAGSGHAVSRLRHGHLLSARVLLPLAFVLLSLGGIAYWHTTKQNSDVEDIDAHLLTGDLPINAYLDKDFDAWLKHSSQ